MTKRPSCPYIEVQRSAHRPMTARGLGRIEVDEKWLCHHPFHGLPVPLGEAVGEAARRCGVCPLPRDAGDREPTPSSHGGSAS